MPNPAVALSLFAVGAFVLAVLLWPGWGLWHRWRRAQHLTERVLTEDGLKHVFFGERHGRPVTLSSLAGDLQISTDRTAQLALSMQQAGLVEMRGDLFALTPPGREAALHIVRAHRLWERYLADRTGFTEAEWHAQAERVEHDLPADALAALAADLGNPTYDPHGDPIPTADLNVIPSRGKPLSTFAVGQAGRIVHIEDEPEVIYSQLVAEGLYLGMEFQVLEVTPQRLRFWADGNEHVLAPLLAANVTVAHAVHAAAPVSTQPGERLSSLALGETAEVTSITRAIRGSERRRLMDLGILPGTRIQAALVSPSGDPTAFLVRDTLVALRREQADMIGIRRPENATVPAAASAA